MFTTTNNWRSLHVSCVRVGWPPTWWRQRAAVGVCWAAGARAQPSAVRARSALPLLKRESIGPRLIARCCSLDANYNTARQNTQNTGGEL